MESGATEEIEGLPNENSELNPVVPTAVVLHRLSRERRIYKLLLAASLVCGGVSGSGPLMALFGLLPFEVERGIALALILVALVAGVFLGVAVVSGSLLFLVQERIEQYSAIHRGDRRREVDV